MAMFPPGLRFMGNKIGLPGFRDGQKWAPEKDAPAAAPPAPMAPPILPPDTAASASSAVSAAQAAAARMRRRAGGGLVLTGGPAGRTGPTAVTAPKTLVGG